MLLFYCFIKLFILNDHFHTFIEIYHMFIKKTGMFSGILPWILPLLFSPGCSPENGPSDYYLKREEKIPAGAEKVLPSNDMYPPVVHSMEYGDAVPLSGKVNTAGGEDSPFMANDRDEFYFFFTPDVKVAVEKQAQDSVTGIYCSRLVNGSWKEPERVILQNNGKLALDGCEWIHGDSMLFCSAREDYTGMNWFLARYIDGKWSEWELFEFNEEYLVGELHILHNELYYHSDRKGGKGGLDIWRLRLENNQWKDPVNIEILNSESNEGWPCISDDGLEIWFTRFYNGSPAIFRSKKVNNEWQGAEMIISQFAGEPTLDKDGNVYFTHHFYRYGEMIEADIYICRRL